MSQSSEPQASCRVRSSMGRRAMRSYSLARSASFAFWWESVRMRVRRRRTVRFGGGLARGGIAQVSDGISTDRLYSFE